MGKLCIDATLLDTVCHQVTTKLHTLTMHSVSVRTCDSRAPQQRSVDVNTDEVPTGQLTDTKQL